MSLANLTFLWNRRLLLCVFLLCPFWLFSQSPSANFTANIISGCSPLVVNFQDQSLGSPTSWSWSFGNGNTSGVQNPTASYFDPGTYTVTLTATNANGSNTLTRTAYIVVHQAPTVNFQADVTNGCFPLRVNFSDLSTPGPNNTNTSWLWDFGNGTTSTSQNPSVTYTTAGSFAITLRVTNDKGCTRVISRSAYINVAPGVTAGFTHTLPTVCQPPAAVSFTNTSTGPGTLTYQWFFGDGSPVSNTPNPTHTYNTTGNYTASLVAISSNGCQDTARTVAPIMVGGYNTRFTGPATICANQPANFVNTSTPVPVSVLWDFGDGNTSTAVNPTHHFATANTYTVTLTANYGNCSETFTQPITVHALPNTTFTASPRFSCAPPLSVTFRDQTPGAVTWNWSFGDGGTSTLQNPVHNYTGYGNFNVRLITTNANGCRDTLIQNNYIRIQRPVIQIAGLPTNGCVPYTINPVPNINTLDAVTSYQWDFGDGSPLVTTQTPTHTYPVQGTYTVTLTITTSTGCTETLTIPAAVRVGTLPSVDFSVSPTITCAYQPVQFTDLSVPADTWLWDFGDGSTSNLEHPSHTYTDTGYFNVTLTAINNGCEASITRTNVIQVLPPIARFVSTANCNNRLEFTFTDQSVGPVSWTWNFGDGSPVITTQNPTHVFPAFGNYVVTLTVTNGSCSHSISQNITTISIAPDFNANQVVICRGESVTFTPFNIPPGSVSNLVWDFGDGSSTILGYSSVTHTYPQAGTYNVMLVAVDINDCRDTIIKNNYIRVNGPIANFTASNVNGCAGTTTTFTDNSTTDGVNAIVSRRFDFGDGTVQTFTAPPYQHTYNQTGVFHVKMTVRDAFGCSDSITLNNLVTLTRPIPEFVSGETLSCPNSSVTFINGTTAAGFTSVWDFGNGVTSTDISPTYSYPAVGIYTVKLFVTDNNGCLDSIVRSNYITVLEPEANFTVNDSIGSCTPLEVQFTNTSTHFNSVHWDFGPGQGTSILENPVHYYNIPGTYRVKLTITSPGGCIDSAFVNIHVEDTVGTRINYTPIAGCNPLAVNLNLTTSSTIESYFWDFGDGNTAITTTPAASHLFQSHGSFLPRVIMQDPSGCLIPVTGLDTIRIAGANVNFGFTPALLCDSGRVSFTDSTTFSDPIRSYQWTFGDGGTSALQNPVHNYTSPGNYDVTLTVQTSISNCTNSFTIPNAIKVVQSPLIRVGGDTATCIHETLLHSGVFIVADTSLVNWRWTFPNGNTAAVQNPPVQTYNTAGSFMVQATATNSSGCVTTVQQPITVNPLPTVTMPGQITVQSGYSVLIPATYSAGVNNWNWTPVRGLSCTDCATPEAGPQFNTKYTVNFSDVNGCRNQSSIDIVVICLNGNLFMPNTFSPNGDGSNDLFYPRGTGLYLIKGLRIFNRWGEIVFEKRDFPPNDALYGWNGRYKNKPPVADVYVYQVEVQCANGETIRLDGNIALIL
jgi:gliding motility-associated-like protein